MATVCVFCASSSSLAQRYLDLAYDVGVALAGAGHTVVSGGGRVGMMGALARGARAGGARTVGVIPTAMVFREVADTYADELVTTVDMAERKSVMMAKSDAFLVLPGGIGTLDELFEVWTTAALRLHAKPVVLVNCAGFFAGLLAWLDELAAAGFLLPGALAQLTTVDTVDAAVVALAGA